MTTSQPRRPTTRRSFQIAVICALPLEADAVQALFDVHWDDDGPQFDKAPGDPNTYSTGVIGRHNVVLAHMPGMGKVSAAAVAAYCGTSFPNIRLALVVGVCGVVPFGLDGEEIILGDVIVSDGVIQYDFGRQRHDGFKRKDTLLDSLGRPNLEIREALAKAKILRSRERLSSKMASYLDMLQHKPRLAAKHPGVAQDWLFEADYIHTNDKVPCDQLGCNGNVVLRQRLQTARGSSEPTVHFGLIASGDRIMKSGKERDAIAEREGIIAFETEGAGVWDTFPCVVIKGACDYADSHKSKAWQRYAAATAAACMKTFLCLLIPSLTAEQRSIPEQPTGPWFIVPYPKNESFVGRHGLLEKLKQQLVPSSSQPRLALAGLGGIGKTQIALAYAYWLQETCPEVSVFWVHASNAGRVRQAYASIAQECHVPDYEDPNSNVPLLVKAWLESKHRGPWLLVIDNADDKQVFYSRQGQGSGLARLIPECSHGSILITTRNKQVGSLLTRSRAVVEVGKMDEHESDRLVRTTLDDHQASSDEILHLSSRLEYIPLALAQAAAYIQMNTITVTKYLQLLDKSNHSVVELLSKEFETIGRDSETPHAMAATWMISFKQIEEQNSLAGGLLSLVSFFDRQNIPPEFLSHYTERGHHTDEDGRLEDWQKEMRIEEALGLLKAFSFISIDRGGNLTVHRLVQLVTRKWLVSRGLVDQFARQALLTVSHLYPHGEFENSAICSAYLPHVYAVLKEGGVDAMIQPVPSTEMAARASLLHRAASFLHYKGQRKEAERLQLQATEIKKRVLGAEYPDT